jgi:hypothetical protein
MDPTTVVPNLNGIDRIGVCPTRTRRLFAIRETSDGRSLARLPVVCAMTSLVTARPRNATGIGRFVIVVG